MSVQNRDILGPSLCTPGSGDNSAAVEPKYDPNTDNPVSGYRPPTPSPRMRATEGYDGVTEDRMTLRENEFNAARSRAYSAADDVTQATSGGGYGVGGE